MEDTACKMLSAANWHKGRTPSEVDALRASGASLPRCDPQRAAARLRKCVVGLQNDWAGTQRVLRHWCVSSLYVHHTKVT